MNRLHVLTAAAVVAGGFFAVRTGLCHRRRQLGRAAMPARPGLRPAEEEVRQAQSGVIDDKSLADYAYALARDGRYQEALDTLDLMQDPNTAEALNYRGYATRKLGRVDEGIGYYKQAVALDPNYTLVREYLGEAYVTKASSTSPGRSSPRSRSAAARPASPTRTSPRRSKKRSEALDALRACPLAAAGPSGRPPPSLRAQGERCTRPGARSVEERHELSPRLPRREFRRRHEARRAGAHHRASEAKSRRRSASLDLHAGIGLYDLTPTEAERTGEWRDGRRAALPRRQLRARRRCPARPRR